MANRKGDRTTPEYWYSELEYITESGERLNAARRAGEETLAIFRNLSSLGEWFVDFPKNVDYGKADAAYRILTRDGLDDKYGEGKYISKWLKYIGNDQLDISGMTGSMAANPGYTQAFNNLDGRGDDAGAMGDYYDLI